LNPQAGDEQAGRRPALDVSPEEYNRRVGLALDRVRSAMYSTIGT